jgi:hypothetical protein
MQNLLKKLFSFFDELQLKVYKQPHLRVQFSNFKKVSFSDLHLSNTQT